MEKPNELLKMLSDKIKYKKEHIGDDLYRLYFREDALDFLEQALTELKAIKEAKPSEALKMLDDLYSNVMEEINYYWKGYKCCEDEVHKYDNDFDTIKQALLNAQEQEKKIDKLENQCLDVLADNIRLEKVLEVIKRVYTDLCFILSFDTFEEYNRSCDLISVKANLKRVNKEEFDLLKRWKK